MENILQKLIPNQITECSICVGPGQHCMTDEAAQAIGRSIGVSGPAHDIITEAKRTYGCSTERCILEHAQSILGPRAQEEITTRLKIPGPTTNKLLSNKHIDQTQQQWKKYFPDYFPYNFNMINYMDYSYLDGYIYNTPDTLATIQFADLYDKYKCCSCIINSDKYQQPGKHWMALFADWRTDNWTVEFFNSSGQPPKPEWVSWLVKTKNAMELIQARDNLKVSIEIVRASDIIHQESKSECGVYSLFYVWARLNGVSAMYFRAPIPDKYMFEFRHHLFEDPSRPPITKFDWQQYKATVPIVWESYAKNK